MLNRLTSPILYSHAYRVPAKASLFAAGTIHECFSCDGDLCSKTFPTNGTRMVTHPCPNYGGLTSGGKRRVLFLCPLCGKFLKSGGPRGGGHFTPAVVGGAAATCTTITDRDKDIHNIMIPNLPSQREETKGAINLAIKEAAGLANVECGASGYGVDGVLGWGTFILPEKHFRDEEYILRALKLALCNTVAADTSDTTVSFQPIPMPVDVMVDFDEQFNALTKSRFKRVLFASTGSDALSLISNSLAHQSLTRKQSQNLVGQRDSFAISQKGMVEGAWGGGGWTCSSVSVGECPLRPVKHNHPANNKVGVCSNSLGDGTRMTIRGPTGRVTSRYCQGTWITKLSRNLQEGRTCWWCKCTTVLG